MKKTLGIIAFFCFLFLTASSFRNSEISTSNGSFAPQFIVNNSSKSFSLHDYRGQYVLVTFWTVADAQSRIQLNELDSAVGEFKNGKNRIEAVAVNFDKSENLFREIVRRDNIDNFAQFHVSGKEAERIRFDYNQENLGMNSFLINPAGRIVAVNPDKNVLKNILG